MKPLHTVTLADALNIVRAGGYPTGPDHLWQLMPGQLDDTQAVYLERRSKVHKYWFVDDTGLSRDNTQVDVWGACPTYDDEAVDVRCSLKAHELGYYVPHLSDVLNRRNAAVPC